MASEEDKNAAIDNLMKQCDRDGVSASIVSDGVVLVFDKTKMKAILDEHPNNERFTIFVKTAVLN